MSKLLKNSLAAAVVIFTFLYISPRAWANEFNAHNAYLHTQHLAEVVGPRPPGSQREVEAGEYIARVFRQYGWQVKIQEFSRVVSIDRGSLKKYSLINSRNVIAEKPGKSQTKTIIGAHYDSADFNVPGAGDNASGVGVLLELAKILGEKQSAQGYVLVAFGAEEAGLVGSRYFVETYDLSKARLMINLDMVGEGNKVAIDGGGKISAPASLLKTAFSLAKKQGLEPEVHRDFMLLARDSKEGGTSDFSPFLDKWIPAIGLGQGGKPPAHYHQPSDVMEHVKEITLDRFGKLVLDLLDYSPEEDPGVAWDDIYLTFDLGVNLVILKLYAVKIFVVFSLCLALFWLVAKRRANWLKLFLLVPTIWFFTALAFLAAFLPLRAIGLIKGLAEPWFAHPGLYLVLQLCTAVFLIYWLSQLFFQLPVKLWLRNPEIYWAGSVILLGAGTAITAASRWDFAFYFALWLLLATLGRFRRGVTLALLGPVMIYNLHWQFLNSHMWTEFYRAFTGHPFIASWIYGFALLPMVLALLACRMDSPLPWPRLTGKVAAAAIVYLTVSVIIAPSYSKLDPQSLSVVQEWQDHKLSLSVSGRDNLPQEMLKILGTSKGGKKVNVPLDPVNEPLTVSLSANKVALNKESLNTIDFKLSYGAIPHLLKLKIVSDKPFTLVNGGSFFPLGKLAKNVKLTGEPVGGVYGLVLERTGPQPTAFQLYVKSEGKITLTLEGEYAGQFVALSYQVPKTLIKYENRWQLVKEI